MKFIGYAVSILTVIVLGCIFNGYAVSVLWQWFVVPVFQAPALTIPTAMGIALLVGYLTYQEVNSSSDNKEPWAIIAEFTARVIVKPTVALLVGWIITLFL